MANTSRDPTKRYKAWGIPIELCKKLEQKIGVPPGRKPNYIEKIKVSDLIITNLEKLVADVKLAPENQKLVEEEIQQNVDARKQENLRRKEIKEKLAKLK